MEKGILEDKLKTYYADVKPGNYRESLVEAIKVYRGKKFLKILDIGSGVGSFAEAIKVFPVKVYALEGSKYGLEMCKKKGIDCKPFILKENNKLPFKDSTFSMILMNQVIEHVDKKVGQYYIQEIVRVLEPGGVCIIKSPSKYSKIWRTDPNHVYCWKPKELLSEVEKYSETVEVINLQRVPLEPWMAFNYNEDIIDTWHKYNKHPFVKKSFYWIMKVLDRLLYKLTGSDRLLAVSNITFVRK